MSEQLLVDTTVIFGVTAAILLLASALFAVLTLRAGPSARQLLVIAAVPTVAMAVGNLLIGQGVATIEVAGADREQSLVRFFGYSVTLAALAVALRRIGSLSDRLFGALLAVFVFTPWGALGSWLTTGALESLITGLTLVGYFLGVYLLFGPTKKYLREIPRDQGLVFAKLRNLFVVCWAALIIQSALSEQALGLTDQFVAQLGASYTEIILAIGIFGLVYAGKEAFEGSGKESEGSSGNESPRTATATPQD